MIDNQSTKSIFLKINFFSEVTISNNYQPTEAATNQAKNYRNQSLSINSKHSKNEKKQMANSTISKVVSINNVNNKSVSKDKIDHVPLIMLTEESKNNKERLKTFGSFFKKKEHQTLELDIKKRYFSPKINLNTDVNNATHNNLTNGNTYKFFIKNGEIKKNSVKAIGELKIKKKAIIKQEIYSFNIENVKLMKEKITKFCNVNNILINEVKKIF